VAETEEWWRRFLLAAENTFRARPNDDLGRQITRAEPRPRRTEAEGRSAGGVRAIGGR
jgi:hypothetical protein